MMLSWWANLVLCRDLHGIIDHSNRKIHAVKTAVMGMSSHFYSGSGGNGDSCLEISIDYCGFTAVMGTISVVLPR